MHALRAVVFDLDDTLYPESSFVLSGFRAVAAWAESRLGVPAGAALDELRALFAAGVTGTTFDRWLADRGLPATLAAEMVGAYRDHFPEIVPHPGVTGLLGRLRPRYRLGVVTDGWGDVQRRKLASLGLEPFLDAVVYSDDLGRRAWKPSRIPYRAALNLLGVSAADALYVADNPAKDFLGARRAGMASVRVRHPGGVYASLEPPSPEHAPDHEVASLGGLEELLARIARAGNRARLPEAEPVA